MDSSIIQNVIQGALSVITGLLAYACKKLLDKVEAQNKEVEKQAAAKEKESEVVRQGVIVTLHMRLYELCQDALDRGYITTEQLRNAEEVYNVYHSLGGNGTGTALYNRMQKLPIENDRKEE